MDVASIQKDLTDYFDAKDKHEESGRTAEPTYHQDNMIKAENRLRSLVGAPMVARKSTGYRY